ncbi:hypothetical protein AB0M20_40825 [Actinoplanes sp. NPDC051633]|uniref:hypothetical protein n=1 Tax=Actinoplanes sp. NPDC051633 TaxID=3155670 RepID=UPI00341AFD7C
MTAHTPKPDHDCAACGEPWPCAPAKVQLAEEYWGRPTALVTYLHMHFREAVGNAAKSHDWAKLDNLYDRFLGWREGARR